jgi:hypothetical protein
VTSRTQPKIGLPTKIRKTGCTHKKDKVKVKNLPQKYAPVSTNDGNRGRAARIKDNMKTETHRFMKTASRRLPFDMPKVPSDESVGIKRERMKRRKGRKQVVHCDRIKICKAHDVLRGEGTELGLEFTEQGSSGSPNTGMDLENQDEDIGLSSKNIKVTDELVGGHRSRRKRRTPTWLKKYVQN